MANMRQVSSNLTLVLKIFFPTFWLVFFGLLALAVWLVGPERGGMLARWDFRLGITVFFIAGAALLYFTLLQLKRVEMDSDYIFVTNYFKSVRYSWSDVEKIVSQPFLSFYIVYIHLKAPGSFGRRIIFLASRTRWRLLLADHPERAALVETL